MRRIFTIDDRAAETVQAMVVLPLCGKTLPKPAISHAGVIRSVQRGVSKCDERVIF
jgi:hypothetical protein